jgi:hypothetical protein
MVGAFGELGFGLFPLFLPWSSPLPGITAQSLR